MSLLYYEIPGRMMITSYFTGSSKLSGVRTTGGQCFLEFCVITIDVAEKTNLRFLVRRSRAVDNRNRDSCDEVHLKIVLGRSSWLSPAPNPSRDRNCVCAKPLGDRAH